MGAFSNSVRREPVARDLRAAQLAALAVASLIDEARLSPKPGLVDSRGSGAHGVWLDTRSISAISGGRSVRDSSSRWNAERMYWSGMSA